MFPHTYRKFAATLGVSLVLGLGAMSMLEPGPSTTGFAVASGGASSFPWPVFLFGLFVGACVVGFVFGIFHHERNRL